MTPTGDPLVSQSVVNGLYITTVTRVAATGGVTFQLRKAEPRRTFIQFFTDGTPGNNGLILPGPPLAFFAIGVTAVVGQAYNWRDCPAMVTGEWYSYFASNSTITVVEQWYTGG